MTTQDYERIITLINSGNISEDVRLDCMAKLIGYERIPPTVEEVIESDEYLGRWFDKRHLYPYWKEKLLELYPNPIETTGFVVAAKGAIGTGKSFFSSAVVHYDLIKLSYLTTEAAHAYFGLTEGTTPWTCRFFNVNLNKATDVFINPFNYILNESPYWQEWRQINHQFLPCNMILYPSSRPNQILSEALFDCIISETNFYRQDVAKAIIDTALGRMTSRFESGKFLFNHCILDSSDTYEDSAVEQFIKAGAYNDCIKIFHTTSWEAKAHKGVYFNEGEFFVYLGDSDHKPFIIEDNTDKSTLDTDRILRVPRELYSEFKSDIIKALQDKAGYSVSTGNLFFPNKELLNDSFILDYAFDDLINLDFFDDISIMDLIGKKKLESVLDPQKQLYIRLDMGLTGDSAGLAICCFDHVKEVVVGSKTYKEMVYSVPFAIGITRPQGQETPFYKLEDFILELSQSFHIKNFSTDQYQSAEIRQNIYMKSNKTIPVSYLSVDTNDRAYVAYKNLVNTHRIRVCKNPILMREQHQLLRISDRKIDHKVGESKDISDAVVGAIMMAINDGIDASDSVQQTRGNYMKALELLKQQRPTVPFRGVMPR